MIARRMNWKSTSTPITYHLRDGFPMYLHKGRGTKINWVSNDDLIYSWELAQCEKTRESYRKGRRREQRQQKRQMKETDSTANFNSSRDTSSAR